MAAKRTNKIKKDPFEDEFLRIHDEMERMVNDILTLHFRNEQLARKHSPFVYGFSMKVTQQGRPEIREFGTALPPKKEWKNEAEMEISREPLIDLIEGKEELSLIAELPGARKEDIHITCTEDSLFLNAKYHEKNYQKQIALPCKVRPDSAKATYKNGVLEVKYRREEPKKEHGRELKIN
ncbi:MAG: archaeal heat shock protein Hsp20 [Candidatus Micrarchaeota archaeon]